MSSSEARHRADAAHPLVSVIMAVHNAERFVGESLDSATSQSYSSLEIVVVDDGSTDATPGVLRDRASNDARIKVITQGNGGVAAARNCAIAASSGEFLAPLDADDLWDPRKIERQVRRLQDYGPRAGIACAWWVWIDAAGLVLDRSPRWRIEGRALERLVEVNFTGSASVPMYRKACVDEIGGYRKMLRANGLQGCEDWDLALRVAERYEVAVVPAVLVGYRRRAHSMSTSSRAMWQSRIDVMEDLAARGAFVPAAALRRSRRQFALYLAGVAFWLGRYPQACWWALRAWPSTLGVVPYVPRVLGRRLLRGLRAGERLAAGVRFDESRLPEPLVPYDRIYAKSDRRG